MLRPETNPSHAFASESETDPQRRRILQWATMGCAAVGAGLAALPFIESWQPSERARALGAPVDVRLDDLAPAHLRLTIWRRQPIFVVRRSAQMVSALPRNDARLRDPHSQQSQQPGYADNEWRSRRADILVLIGVCTHLGCLPKARFLAGDPTLGKSWPGGFYCPCHGSTYDMAGRVFRDVPAPRNLAVPPYAFVNNELVRIGVNAVSSSKS